MTKKSSSDATGAGSTKRKSGSVAASVAKVSGGDGVKSPRKPSALARAIESGIASGDLRAAFRPLAEYKVVSHADAVAICDLLRRLEPDRKAGFLRRLGSAATLFRKVSDMGSPAGRLLTLEGIPLLQRRLDGLVAEGGNLEGDALDVTFSILGILARYGTVEGADGVIATAWGGLASESHQWGNVFSNFRPGHPQLRRLFAAVSDRIPEGEPGRQLLWVANRSSGKATGLRHPFDHPAGHDRLSQWMHAADATDGSVPLEAVAAIPFMGRSGRSRLLAVAERSPIPAVRLEAAGTAAKLGLKSGLRRLVRLCGDWKTTTAAQEFLRQLKRADLIPSGVREPSFAALAKMCDWLADPSELGQVPESLEIVDHRSWVWPPGRRRKPFWIIRYRAASADGEDGAVQSGIGLVGSVTFSLFGIDLAARQPEDIYGMHCAWELIQAGLLSERPAGAPGMMEDEGDDETDVWIPRWPGEPLKNAKLARVARFSPKLGYPRHAVGLVRANRKGRKGHAIVDGERSAWVPMPNPFVGDLAEYEAILIRIQVGRRLLGV